MPIEMRRKWACPDLGLVKREGCYLPIPGSREEFPGCPAYSLRTAGMGMPADHLIDGAIHPAHLIQPKTVELEAGALVADSLSPKVHELTHLWLREKQSRREYEQEQRKKG